MGDLSRNAADLPIVLIGATTAGVATTPVGADSNGNLYVNTRVTASVLDVTPATQSITTQDIGSTSNTYFNNQAWVSGTPTAGSVASFALTSFETGTLEITGTWTGTLTCETSFDNGVNWIAHSLHQIGAPTFSSSFTNNFVGSINLAAKTNVRVRATAAFTGTATILFNFSNNPSSVYVANAVKVVDGSSTTSTTTMTIKAASTPAASTDTAVVVGLSPNSSVVGTVAPGIAAVNSVLIGGQYNSTITTLTTGQQAANQLDSQGRMLISSKTPRTFSAPVTATVNTTSTLVLAANTLRKGLYLSNTSPQQISFGFDGNAATYQYGLTLYPGEKFWMDEYSYSVGAVYAITTGSVAYIGIQEIT